MGKIKPTSIKLTKEKLDEIDTECEGLGCNRTDFIKEAIDTKLEGEKPQDQEIKNDTKTDNSSPKSSEETPKGIITKISNDDGKTWTKVNNSDKPRQKVVIDWDEPTKKRQVVYLDDSKEEQKITIKEVPQDNSQRPPVPFTQFNGKLLPFAKRYDI